MRVSREHQYLQPHPDEYCNHQQLLVSIYPLQTLTNWKMLVDHCHVFLQQLPPEICFPFVWVQSSLLRSATLLWTPFMLRNNVCSWQPASASFNQSATKLASVWLPQQWRAQQDCNNSWSSDTWKYYHYFQPPLDSRAKSYLWPCIFYSEVRYRNGNSTETWYLMMLGIFINCLLKVYDLRNIVAMS